MPNAGLLPNQITAREVPGGPINCQNLVFTTSQPFVPGTLEVYLDGVWKEPGLDFEENPNGQSFTILINPGDPNRLETPPTPSESLWVKYAIC